MFQILFAPWTGLLLGILPVIVLLGKKRTGATLNDAVIAFLGGPSFWGGAKMCVLAFTLTSAQADPLQIDRVPLFLGGLWAWVSIQAVWQAVRGVR